jgi:chemotaxis protein MotB
MLKMKMKKILFYSFAGLMITSCVSKKKLVEMETLHKAEMEVANKQLGDCGENLNKYMQLLSACESDKSVLRNQISNKDEAISELKGQITDIRSTRDKQIEQVGNMTVMTQSANENMKKTLDQLAGKDKYINLLQQAKTKADSINLALGVNLKQVLKEGISDSDIEVKVDKTVVFVNLSDKMLYQVGSANLTPKATEVLGKIAEILKSRPELEMMVEGYTDNTPISNDCLKDNWDLSVKRATSVVRVLQTQYKIDPNRLIAAGRGEYNTLAPNDTPANKATNRRTRIILLPRLDQFYDLLNPNNLPKN